MNNFQEKIDQSWCLIHDRSIKANPVEWQILANQIEIMKFLSELEKNKKENESIIP